MKCIPSQKQVSASGGLIARQFVHCRQSDVSETGFSIGRSDRCRSSQRRGGKVSQKQVSASGGLIPSLNLQIADGLGLRNRFQHRAV